MFGHQPGGSMNTPSSFLGQPQANSNDRTQTVMHAAQPVVQGAYGIPYQMQYNAQPQFMTRPVMTPMGQVAANVGYPMMQPSMQGIQPTTVHPMPTLSNPVTRPGQLQHGMGAPPSVIPMRPSYSPTMMPARPTGGQTMIRPVVQQPRMQQRTSTAATASQPFTMDQYMQMMKAFAEGKEQKEDAKTEGQQAPDAQDRTEKEADPDGASGEEQTNIEANAEADPASQSHDAITEQTNILMHPAEGYTLDSVMGIESVAGLDAQANMMMANTEQQFFQNGFGFFQMPTEPQPCFFGSDVMQQGGILMPFQMPTDFVDPGTDLGGMMQPDPLGQTMDLFGATGGGNDMFTGGNDMFTGGNEW